MKNTKKNSSTYIGKLIAFLLIVLFSLPAVSFAQNSKDEKETTIKNLIQSRNFVFVVQSAMPMSGSVQQVNGFDLRLLGDSIQSYLPYFGRAYSAPVYPSRGGIEFTSTDFAYEVKKTKRGGWQISITPKDTKEAREMTLNVSSEGYATLHVISNNRQAISYRGQVIPRRNYSPEV